MRLRGLNDSKYSVKQICKQKNVAPFTQRLLETFHERLRNDLARTGITLNSRTHDRGITYLCTERKAFIYLNINKKHLTLYFFTGEGQISGLDKGSWRESKETHGSRSSNRCKGFLIKDFDTINTAVRFGLESYELTRKWLNR